LSGFFWVINFWYFLDVEVAILGLIGIRAGALGLSRTLSLRIRSRCFWLPGTISVNDCSLSCFEKRSHRDVDLPVEGNA
jgi:hypothetical protein